MLQDLVAAAVNDALNLSRALMEREMGALAGFLKPPFPL
jgi:DNA-binding protein YbaB